MAIAKPQNTADALHAYTVTRALCVGGERMEVGAPLELTKSQASELVQAGKVVLTASLPAPALTPEPAKAPAKPAKAAKASEPADAAEPAPVQDADPDLLSAA